MSRREVVLVAALVLMLALVLWQGRNTERALDHIGAQLSAQERARIDMLEARVIALEKTQARIRAEVEGD